MDLFEQLFTPPSPEKTQTLEAEKAKLKAKQEIQDALTDALASAMLESGMPEHRKAGIRLAMKSKKVRKALIEIVSTYADPHLDEEKEKAVYPVRQEVINFLDQLEESINEFISSHPLPAENIGGTE